MKQFIYRINGQEYVVAVNKMDNSLAEVAVNGTQYKVELVNNNEELTFTSRPVAKAAAPAPAAPRATAPAASSRPAGGNSAGALKSPLPGIVVGVNVNVGDVVKKGQQVATLEAMKMENALSAPIDGTVQSIDVNVGDSVLEGVTILTIG